MPLEAVKHLAMPIIRARYPDNWPDIALQVKQDANWCCEQCQRPGRQPGESEVAFFKRVQRWRRHRTPRPALYREAPRRYVLTVAHLDQQPHNQDRANLKALCTVCHLQFDSRFRATQKRLKAEFYGQLCLEGPWTEGLQLSLLPQQVSPFSLPPQGEAPDEGRWRSHPEA